MIRQSNAAFTSARSMKHSALATPMTMLIYELLTHGIGYFVINPSSNGLTHRQQSTQTVAGQQQKCDFHETNVRLPSDKDPSSNTHAHTYMKVLSTLHRTVRRLAGVGISRTHAHT